jgi:hypothetical protein
MAVEKVSSWARKRKFGPANGATIAQLRDREAINYADRTDNIIKAETSPGATASNAKQSSQNRTGSRRSARDDRHNAPRSARKFIASHKKGGIAILAVILVSSALFVGSIVVAGPAQFLQFAGLVKGSIQFMSDSVSSTRIMRDVVNIAQGATLDSSSVGNNRIEKMGRLMTASYTSQLAKNGIKFNKGSTTVTIDLEERYNQASFNEDKIKQRLSNELGVGIDALSYNRSNNTVTFSTSGGSWNDEQNNQFLLALEKEIGNPSSRQASSFRRNRMTMRLDLYDWRHPINHDSFEKLEESMGSRLEAWLVSRLLKMTGQKLNDSTTDLNKLKTILDKKMARRATNFDTNSMNNDPTSGWMSLALAMSCVNYRTARSPQLYSRVVMPAIMEALALRSIEGQLRSIALDTLDSGLQDFSFDDLAGLTQDYFYDDIKLSSGETVGVNGWSGAPVKAALGYEPSDEDMANTVDYALRILELKGQTDTQDPKIIIGDDDLMLDLCDDFFDNVNPTASVADFLASSISGEAEGVLNWIKSKFGFEQMYWTQKVQGMGDYLLQTLSMDPSQKLSTAMYGSKFLEDYDNATIGGRELEPDEVTALYRDSQSRLAKDYNNSSIMAKLFDPADYRSALSEVARKSNWDTSGGSIFAHLANIGKTFAQTPVVLISNLGAVFGGKAQAATAVPYDYGVPWFGYSIDEQKQLRDVDDARTSVFGNAKELYKMLGRSGGAEQLYYLGAVGCFSTAIAEDATLAEIKNLNNPADILTKDGVFNIGYVAGERFSYGACHTLGFSLEDQMTFRTYLLDYNLLSAAACFEGSSSPDERFDSNGDGVDDMSFGELGIIACSDFTDGKPL